MSQPFDSSSSAESRAQTPSDDAIAPSNANTVYAQSDCEGKIDCGSKLGGTMKPLDDSLLAEALRHLSRFELDNLPMVGRQWGRVVDTLPQYRVLFNDYGVDNWKSPRYSNALSPIESLLMREDPVETHNHWASMPMEILQKNYGYRIIDTLKTAELIPYTKKSDPTQKPYKVRFSFDGVEQLEKLFDCSPRLRTRGFVLSCLDASPRRLELMLGAAERFRPMWEGSLTIVDGSPQGNFISAIPRLFANCPRITFEDGARWSWQGKVAFGSVESGTNSCAAIELGAWDGIQLEHVTNYLFSGLEMGGEDPVGCGGGGQKRRLEVNYFGYFNREASAFSSEILMRLIQERLVSIAPRVPTFKLMINLKSDLNPYQADGAWDEEKLVVDLLPEKSRHCLSHTHASAAESTPPQQMDANEPSAANALRHSRNTHHCTFSSGLGILTINCQTHCIPIVHIEVECGDVGEKWGKPKFPMVFKDAKEEPKLDEKGEGNGDDKEMPKQNEEEEEAERPTLDEEGNGHDDEGTEKALPPVCKPGGTSYNNSAKSKTKTESPQGEGGSSMTPSMTEDEKINRALSESFLADMEALECGELKTNEEKDQLLTSALTKACAMLDGMCNKGKKQNPDHDAENGNDKSSNDRHKK